MAFREGGRFGTSNLTFSLTVSMALWSFEVVVTSETGLPFESTLCAFSRSSPASAVWSVMRVTWSLNMVTAAAISSGMDLQPLSRVQSSATAMTSTVSFLFIVISSLFHYSPILQ